MKLTSGGAIIWIQMSVQCFGICRKVLAKSLLKWMLSSFLSWLSLCFSSNDCHILQSRAWGFSHSSFSSFPSPAYSLPKTNPMPTKGVQHNSEEIPLQSPPFLTRNHNDTVGFRSRVSKVINQTSIPVIWPFTELDGGVHKHGLTSNQEHILIHRKSPSSSPSNMHNPLTINTVCPVFMLVNSSDKSATFY